MAALTSEAVNEKLKALGSWKLTEGMIVREATFRDFLAAMAFVNWVATEAEAAGHHPDIDIRYNRVRLALVTHDAGGLTEKDFQLATVIEGMLGKTGA